MTKSYETMSNILSFTFIYYKLQLCMIHHAQKFTFTCYKGLLKFRHTIIFIKNENIYFEMN
jgi:hypothetical protein